MADIKWSKVAAGWYTTHHNGHAVAVICHRVYGSQDARPWWNAIVDNQCEDAAPTKAEAQDLAIRQAERIR